MLIFKKLDFVCTSFNGRLIRIFKGNAESCFIKVCPRRIFGYINGLERITENYSFTYSLIVVIIIFSFLLYFHVRKRCLYERSCLNACLYLHEIPGTK
jgi:hypothetical protein